VDRKGNGLGLEVLLEALEPSLATNAAGLVPAEWRVGGVPVGAVHSQRPGPDAPGYAQGPFVGGRADASGQAVHGVVGNGNRLFVIVEGNDHEHGTKDLLLGDPHPIVHISEQRRLDVIPAVEASRSAASGDDASAFATPALDVVEDTDPLVSVDEGAGEDSRIVRIADLHAREAFRHDRQSFLVARTGEEQAGGERATLASVDTYERRGRQYRFEIGIVQDDHRGLATELQKESLDAASAELHDPSPSRSRSGERDEVDARILDQLLSSLM
jgi:hypothetical protein